MKTLHLHNTLSRRKELFTPHDADHVKVYACGPTVYNFAHIGNARLAVVCDVLARVLRAQFPKVTYASNITDVDDKIIKAAAETGEAIYAITEKYTRIYNEDMAALNVQQPDIQPRATQHIGDMIALIEKLIENDYAYAVDGHVLYHTAAYKNYGKLSNRSRDEQVAGARVEIAPYKKDAADFVLWKPSDDDQPAWDSPWGKGRPGWHIECSAMAETVLGLPFDIHGGGADLTFPHHENEIAQSCGAHNLDDPADYAKYWVHNGFVTVENEKMSKSIGNVRLVHDLVQHYKGEALRLALLSAQYRQPLNWSEDVIEQSKKTLDKLYRALKDMADIEAADNADNPILEALNDDLNTPKAIAELNALLSRTAKADRDEKAQIKAALLSAGAVLGILQSDPDEWLGYASDGDVDAAAIAALITKRNQARANKDFATADAVRDELKAMGIEIEDKAGETVWKRV